MQRWRLLLLSVILFAGCNLTIKEWNSNKVLPIEVSLPIIDSTYTIEEFVNKNPTYLFVGNDTIYFSEDTTIINTYLAIDSTFSASFGHNLPDAFDSTQTSINSRIPFIFGTIKLKGNVVLPFNMSVIFSYYPKNSPAESTVVQISFPNTGPIDTTIIITINDALLSDFSITIRGQGTLGAIQVDTMYISYTIPSAFDFRGDTIVLKEFEVPIDSTIIEWAQKELIDTLQLFARGSNRIPAGLHLETFLINKTKTDTAQVIDIPIDPAATDNQGFASSETPWNFVVTLSKENINKFFTEDTLYLVQKIIVPAQQRPCVIRAQDYINYKVYFRLLANLDFEKLTEE